MRVKATDNIRFFPLGRMILLMICAATIFSKDSRIAGAQDASHRDATALLRGHLASQVPLHRVSMRVNTEFKALEPANDDLLQRAEVLYRRDDDLLDISARYQFLSKKRAQASQKFRVVINKDLCLMYGFRYSMRDHPDAGIATKNRSRMFDMYIGNLFHGNALEGYVLFSDRKSLAELMLEANTLRVRGDEVVHGILCKIVEATTPYGYIALWIDEEKGFIIRKFIYRKGPDDLAYDDKPLRETQVNTDNKQLFTINWSVTLDQVEVVKIGGTYVSVEGKLTESISRSDGQSSVSHYLYKRSNVELNPSFKETDAFAIDLPEGIRINNKDDPSSGIVYVWRQGKVVPSADGFVSYSEFGNKKGRSVFALVLSGVFGLFVLVIAIWRVYRFKLKH